MDLIRRALHAWRLEQVELRAAGKLKPSRSLSYGALA